MKEAQDSRDQQGTENNTSSRQTKRTARRDAGRLIPIWLRVVITAFLLMLSVILGTMVGYGVIGEGEPMKALQPSTWQHIYDLIYKD